MNEVISVVETRCVARCLRESARQGGELAVLLVGHQPVVAAGLHGLIERESDLSVAGVVRSIEELRVSTFTEQADLLMVDIDAWGGDLSGLERVIEVSGGARVMVLTMHCGGDCVRRVLELGVVGYCLKTDRLADLLGAIRAVGAGRVAVSPRARQPLDDGASSGPVCPARLSVREREVFRLMGEGLKVRLIAGRLGVSVKTVETHRENIKQKLGLATGEKLRVAAAVWFAHSGLARSLG